MDRLPDHASLGDLRLVRWTADDAEALAELVTANVEHLRPRMAWVAHEPLSLADRRGLLEQWDEAWRAGGDASYRIERNGEAAGGCGLHARLGPGELEIGYWVDHRHQGCGVATAAAALLTDLAFGVADVHAVEIHHDRTNLASRRVPEKLGYRWMGERRAERPLAPSDTGWDGIWRIDRSAWPGAAELGVAPAG